MTGVPDLCAVVPIGNVMDPVPGITALLAIAIALLPLPEIDIWFVVPVIDENVKFADPSVCKN